jgi:hypothetical protein
MSGMPANASTLVAAAHLLRDADMKVRSIAATTIAVCLLSLAIDVILVANPTFRLTPSDTTLVLLVIVPHVLLALFAWWQRHRPVISYALLAVAAGLATWGLCMFGVERYRYHTEWEYSRVMNPLPHVIALVQSGLVVLVGLILVVMWLVSRRASPVKHSPGSSLKAEEA